MLLDCNNKYFTPEGLGCTLSHSSAISYSRARGSTRFGPCPYPSLRVIAVRINANNPHDSWYDHSGDDLHFCDFGFQACIKVTHQLSQRADGRVGRDRVLERLLVDRTFYREELLVTNTAEGYTMQHASAIGLHLLARVEDLEQHVHYNFLVCYNSSNSSFSLGLLMLTSQVCWGLRTLSSLLQREWMFT
jgi:hypothetical protein